MSNTDNTLQSGTIVNSVKRLSTRYLELVEKYKVSLIDSEKNKIDNDVYMLLNVNKPKIMFTGVYNAGKSTLVNALLGRIEAAMSDKPETCKIAEYDNGDYTIVDTPGVDAPVEHEELTHEHRKQSHAVFFVMSTSGTFEDKKNYNEMIEIIDMGKQLQIVLNNKSDYDSEDNPDLIRLREKVLDNLKKYSGNDNIVDKYDVLFVNAKTALKGKIENKKNLIEHSNIHIIETAIKMFLKKENAFKLLEAPCYNLKQIIKEFSEKLIKNNTAVNQYEHELIELERKRDIIVTDIENLAKRTILSYEDRLVEQAMTNSLNIDIVMREINDSINNYLESAKVETDKFINKAFYELLKSKSAGEMHVDEADGTSLKNTITAYEIPENNYNPYIDSDFSLSRDNDDTELGSGVGKLLKAAVPGVVAAIGIPVLGVPAAIITAGVTLITSLLFGSSSKKKEEALMREIQEANRRATHHAAEQIRQRQEARTKVRMALSELSESYTRNARNSINAYFSEITDGVHRLVSKNKEDYNYVSSIQRELDAIRFEIENIIDRI